MRKGTASYWVVTGLMLVMMGVGAIPDLLSDPQAVELFEKLGYPLYLLPFIGAAKLLGVIAILVPGFPRVKEWAYAGFVFDLTGALYSTLAIGDFLSALTFPVGYALIAGSYLLHHRRMGGKSLKTAASFQA